MAGVIASVSLHSKDLKSQKSPLSTCKSNYIIRQFDKTFTPSKHNIFMVRRAYFLEKTRKQREKAAVKIIDSDQEDTNQGLSTPRLICEMLLLSKEV